MTDIIERLKEACNGHPAAKIPWPHRLLHDAIAEIERLRDDRNIRTGAHILRSAKSLGWKDDGEGALEFMLRRSREVAIEDRPCSHHWSEPFDGAVKCIRCGAALRLQDEDDR
jgi:hypothetical protein